MITRRTLGDDRAVARLATRLWAVVAILGSLAFLTSFVADDAATAIGSSWVPQPIPRPRGSKGTKLAAVSCSSTRSCVAVGSFRRRGRVFTLAERWNGKLWSITSTPNVARSDNVLEGVSCSSRTSCVAVGSFSNPNLLRPLTERWNGSRWSIVPSPGPVVSDWSELLGVSCTSRTACTAVGDMHVRGTSENGSASTLVERWNGTRWAPEQTNQRPAGKNVYQFNAVACATKAMCIAVGAWSAGYFPLIGRWNGRRWATGAPAEEGEQLSGVSCTSSSRCIAVGGAHSSLGSPPLIWRWNGSTWSELLFEGPDQFNPLEGSLTAVSCPSAISCVAVGSNGNGGPLMLRLAGTTWAAEPFSFGDSLDGVSCTAAGQCVVVGSDRHGPLVARYA